LLRYRASGRAVEELERNLKLTDGILRYLTVRCEDETTITNPMAHRPHVDEPRQSPEQEAVKVPQAKVEPPASA
jgi:ribosomal protein S6